MGAMCENCRFYQPARVPDCGECRRLPPVIIVTPEEGPGWSARRQVGIWPLIDEPLEWCGEWAPIKGEASLPG